MVEAVSADLKQIAIGEMTDQDRAEALKELPREDLPKVAKI